MKKKIFSLLGILIFGLNTVFCEAVEISFVSLDSQNEEFYIDDEESLQEIKNIFHEEKNIFENEKEILVLNSSSNFQESSLKVTDENLFSEKRINLLNLENENPVEKLPTPENLDYTTVDITDVFTGNIISHDCNLYLISNFDETEHWNECTVCGKILNKEEHTYIDNGWTSGTANNCNNANVHMFVCECGMSYSNTTGRKAHVFGNPFSNDSNYTYYATCKNCSGASNFIHYCQKSDGSQISCSNPGKCKLCGYNYTAFHVGRCNINMNDIEGDVDVYCDLCQKYLGTTSFQITPTSDGYVTIYNEASVNGNYSSLTYYLKNYDSNCSISSKVQSGLSQTVNLKYNIYTENIQHTLVAFDYYQDGEKNRIATYFFAKPEYTPPVITDINSNSGNWTTDSTIFITGTENYCHSVNLTIKDTDGNIYAENVTASVTNNTWNYEIKPSLESQDNTEFILQVTDALDNTTEESFYLSKIDTVPPKAIENEILNTEWSKTKKYVFTSSDYGIGQVQNSAISTDNYELATENENLFYKGYIFTGDVYGETLVPVYMKDGLNNQNVEFIKVSNLDNTTPSIENIVMNKSLHNTEVVISANDINEKLNATGSGVTGYAISKKNEMPATFQEENTFNISESGKCYLFITDLVGNVASRELNVPVQYKVTINPDGGTWKGSTLPQEIETDEPINLYPEPEKEGYTFKEWNISGEGEIIEDGELIISGDVEVTPIWEANQYSVTFIDYDVTHNRIINTTTREADFNSEISGTYIGNDTSDNAYYKQYKLISDTSITISTNPENNIVYRYFEFCYTEKESHINFNDNNNEDGLRPETYKLQLILEDGTLIDEVTLPTSQPDYVFENLPQYDEQGEEYKYKIIPIISDRYDVIPNPEDESTPEISYNNPECSINIPKTTTLDGKNGDLTYTIQITSNLFYKDKIIIVPEENVTLTDGVKNMNATIIQNKTEFTKDDELKITGRIQTVKKHFAGTWKGTFNFEIRYEVKN